MSSLNTTWRKQLTAAFAKNKESWDDVESITLSEEQLNCKFYPGYGGSEGDPFTVWTKNRVYFPVVYDGSEWVESVSRNPDGKPTAHFGGE